MFLDKEREQVFNCVNTLISSMYLEDMSSDLINEMNSLAVRPTLNNRLNVVVDR